MVISYTYCLRLFWLSIQAYKVKPSPPEEGISFFKHRCLMFENFERQNTICFLSCVGTKSPMPFFFHLFTYSPTSNKYKILMRLILVHMFSRSCLIKGHFLYLNVQSETSFKLWVDISNNYYVILKLLL